MPARSGCCCANEKISTLHKVDANGNIVWSVNHYSDYGAPVAKFPRNNPPTASYGNGLNDRNNSNVNHYAGIDGSGNYYQVGGPSVAVVANKALSQPTIDSLRKYDTNGNKVWGWSTLPTGDVSGATRIGPYILTALAVAKNGTCIVQYSDGVNPVQWFTGIDSSGSTIWSFSLSNTTYYDSVSRTGPLLKGAGDQYFIIRLNNDTSHYVPSSGVVWTPGLQIAVFKVATGSWYITLNPEAATGAISDTRNHLECTMSHDDEVYTIFDTTKMEQYLGSAQVRVTKIDMTTTSNSARFTTQCQYIRESARIGFDSVNGLVFASGYREILAGGNPSYNDYLGISELFNQSSGASMRPILAFDNTRTVNRHANIPTAMVNNAMYYQYGVAPDNYTIYTIDPTGDHAEVPTRSWAYSCTLGQVDETNGNQAWYHSPYCRISLSNLPGCGSTYTYTAQSDGMGGFEWVMPGSFRCSGASNCYIPQPAIAPTSLDDTYVVTCLQGVVCTGHTTYTSTGDRGTSVPTGYTVPPNIYYYKTWASPSTTSDCSFPCYNYPTPSIRGTTVSAEGSETIDIRCS